MTFPPRVPAGALALLLGALAAAACDAAKSQLAQGGEECSNSRDYTGRSLPFHTIPIDNGNDFNTSREAFRTSTRAQTGYTAYATWDECALYLGYTGSAVGTGDCSDPSRPTCAVPDLPQSPDKYLLYYLNTDPRGGAGTRDAMPYGRQDWILPFRADYLLSIRTDGRSVVRDSLVYVGNARLFRAGGGGWVPVGDARLTIGDNSSSNFLEAKLPQAAIGSPCAVEVAAWVVDTRHGASYAFWPAENGSATGDSARGGAPGGRADSARASGPRTDSARRPASRSDSARDSASHPGSARHPSARADSARRSASGGDAARSPGSRPRSATPIDSGSRSARGGARARSAPAGADTSASGGSRSPRRLQHYYGFELRSGVIPNASANLDRTAYGSAADCAGGGR